MFQQILGGSPYAAAEAKKKRDATPDCPGNTVANPDFRILEVIVGLAGKFKKTYSFPTQEKLLELIQRFTGRSMCRRTLNRHLRALERGGWLHRQRRHRYDAKLGFVFRSTCYRPMWRYCQRLQRNANAIFSMLGAQLASNPSNRVSSMAQNLNIFFKKFISGP